MVIIGIIIKDVIGGIQLRTSFWLAQPNVQLPLVSELRLIENICNIHVWTNTVDFHSVNADMLNIDDFLLLGFKGTRILLCKND